jgi:cellulose synthase/poly-beta-1,6-N-acetylglucosamine synthase-like glycosyltransferase
MASPQTTIRPALLRLQALRCGVRSFPVLQGATRATYLALVLLWLVANAAFWQWWLRPERAGSPWLYAVFTAAFGYQLTFLPAMYAFFTGRMRRPEARPAPRDVNVALVTLCVPGQEAIEVISAQLRALAAVSYPHDSWILDEAGDARVRTLAESLGIRYFTRAGRPKYNQPAPPFEAATKAGNVNAWLDVHGAAYDVFVQFDIDHVPAPDYLDHVLGYFDDPDVAWVQAPSVYGNLSSWVARGAAEQELVLQGPLQRGFYGNADMPFIIGSHTSYRTHAVVEIGGFQPTRAEDHLDTVVLASHGYRGVFVPDVLAVGQGPETFRTYLRQQFAWAASLIQVLLRYTPRHLRRLTPAQVVQVLFTESWYPLWALSLLLLFALPPFALLTNTSLTTVPLPAFVAAWTPLSAANWLLYLWSRRWHTPREVTLSWRGIVLHVARWPVVLWALINVVFGVKHPYMITPKGARTGLPSFHLRDYIPYLLGVWLPSLVVCLRLRGASYASAGQHLRALVDGAPALGLLTLVGAGFMLAVFGSSLCLDLGELMKLGIPRLKVIGLRLAPLAVLLGTLVVFGAAAAAL